MIKVIVGNSAAFSVPRSLVQPGGLRLPREPERDVLICESATCNSETEPCDPEPSPLYLPDHDGVCFGLILRFLAEGDLTPQVLSDLAPTDVHYIRLCLKLAQEAEFFQF